MTYVPVSLREDWRAVGGLSNPSKMPCLGYSFPATRCGVGGKLAKVAGTVCSSCYALKGRYVMPNVAEAMERRFQLWQANPDAWERSMVRLIEHYGERDGGYFRWHDSGDVQSLAHLEQIARIAAATPTVRHWLPTREAGIVSWYLLRHGAFPANLTVRLSDSKIDRPVQVRAGVCASGVHRGDTPNGSAACPAYQQDGFCGDCRACWDPSVPRVSYPLH